MPTFYWVGKGCPRDGTPTNSHQWGLSDYDWNTPSNWVVAHSLHAHRLVPGSGVSTPTIRVLTEVYAIPNRCPGPGDEVFVGHFPWLRHQPMSRSGEFAIYDLYQRTPEATVIGVNDLFWNSTAWQPDTAGRGELSAPGFSKAASPEQATVQQVLYAPIDPLNGKVTTVSVPKALEGTSTVPLYRRFYATNSTSLSPNVGVPTTAYSWWWDGPSTWLNQVQPGEQVNEVGRISSILSVDMTRKNEYRNKRGYFLPSYQYFTRLPKKAESPLLWGGCVAGSTGTTAESGISGGSGYTYWRNANTISANPNIIAATAQALDTLNIVMYSDSLVEGITASGSVLVPTMGATAYTYNIAFYDPYPFKSVGDGLYGEEYETVVANLRKPYCGGWTGGMLTQLDDCYNCYGAGATGATSQRLLTLDRVVSKSLTAEGARINGLFVKAHNVNVRSPFEWNKYAGNNPLGFQNFREDRAPVDRPSCRLFSGSGVTPISCGDSWIARQIGDSCINSSGEYDGNCAENFGGWAVSGRNNKDKFVELRLAEFYNGPTGTDQENLKTILHADMRFGQFNLAYGRVQEANLGTPHGSYGNEYGEGPKTIYGLSSYNTGTPAIVSWDYSDIRNALSYYRTQSLNPYFVGKETTYIRSEQEAYGRANPFWPSSGVYFIGGLSGQIESRVNQLNLFSVSATINPMTKVGVSRIFLGYGDNVEFGGQCLTANSANPYNYTKDMGNIYVNHGYPVIAPNNTSLNAAVSMGSFFHGSTVTGDSFYAPYIVIKPLGLQDQGFDGGTGMSGGETEIRLVKTAFTSPIFNSQIGDLVIDNTDFVFVSPDDIGVRDRQKYGNKVIDRLIVKNESVVDYTNDTAGYLHFGRILNSGSTGGTGSVYGGILFQGEKDQFVVPPAGARLWISRIDGNTIDSRQKTMSVGFVATNFPEGKLDKLGNFPSELDASGTVTSTGKNPNAFNQNLIANAKMENQLGLEDELGDPEVPVA